MNGVLHLPPDLDPVAALVADALARVEQRFDSALASDTGPVNELCAHVERYRGKMLRPILAILSGVACAPDAADAFARGDAASLVSEDLITVAAVCEMVHMATLVHDDVLDEADTRRRARTVNALRGNEPAVMLGDYLIATAFHLCSSLDSQLAALAVGRASRATCAGELLQLAHREDLDLDEPTYFEIVAGKTGALTEVACELGALCAIAPAPARDALATYGRSLGVAFQIQDDLLDLRATEAQTGKPVGKDLEKGKLTLPIIHHLRAADPAQRERSLALVRAHDPAIGAALALTGSVEYAERTARRLVDEAKKNLGELPETPARGVLDRLAEAVINRSC